MFYQTMKICDVTFSQIFLWEDYRFESFEAEIRFIAGQSQHGVDLDDELGANAAGRPRRSAAAAAATAILQQSTGTSLFYFYIVLEIGTIK